jgi:hypothetical protein
MKYGCDGSLQIQDVCYTHIGIDKKTIISGGKNDNKTRNGK